MAFLLISHAVLCSLATCYFTPVCVSLGKMLKELCDFGCYSHTAHWCAPTREKKKMCESTCLLTYSQ